MPGLPNGMNVIKVDPYLKNEGKIFEFFKCPQAVNDLGRLVINLRNRLPGRVHFS